MLLAIAVLLMQPQAVTKLPLSAEKAALIQPAAIETISTEDTVETSLTAELDVTPAMPATSEALPEAPVPSPIVGTPAVNAFIKHKGVIQ